VRLLDKLPVATVKTRIKSEHPCGNVAQFFASQPLVRTIAKQKFTGKQTDKSMCKSQNETVGHPAFSNSRNSHEQTHVSAGQLCDLRTRPVHVASRTATYGFSTITDDAMALR